MPTPPPWSQGTTIMGGSSRTSQLHPKPPGLGADCCKPVSFLCKLSPLVLDTMWLKASP